MLADSTEGYHLNLTTTGLNRFFKQNEPPPPPAPVALPTPPPAQIGKNKSKKTNATKVTPVVVQKAPPPPPPPQKPFGFVAMFGADKPVDIKFDLERVQNVRVRKDDSTMELSADISLEFWINNGTSNQALALSLKDSKFFYNVLQSPDNQTNLINQIVSFEIGDINVDNSALVNFSDLSANNSNFDLNMSKVEVYLESIKDPIAICINKYLSTQQYSLPSSLFYGIFEFSLQKVTLTYYDGYIAINANPHVRKIHYDETSEPRLIYQKFNGQIAPDLEDTNFVFTEELKQNGEVQQKRIRDFSLLESFTN